MPGPAARMGDMTAHGGTIALGFPTVLIGGVPAARLTDMHVCPMVTPGVPPIPHVGGPVVGPGVPTVLIGGMPAATVGDMLVCVGPPDTIALGCFTVMIGTGGGSGSGGGGGGGGGAGGGTGSGAGGAQGKAAGKNQQFAKGAPASATAAASYASNSGNAEHTDVERHWIEFQFVDSAGLPVSGVPYELTLPDGKKSTSILNGGGKIRRGVPKAGQAKVVLQSVGEAKWAKATAKAGDSVTMSAKADGFEPGTEGAFLVFRRDIRGPDNLISRIEASMQGGKLESPWELVQNPDTEPVVTKEGETGTTAGSGSYSAPQYYFEVVVGACKSRSGLLTYAGSLNIEVTNDDGEPLKDEDYVLFLSNGEVRKGKLDGSGKLEHNDVPLGPAGLRLPNLPDIEAER